MTLELVRFAYTPIGTFGRLYLPEFQCFTVERPWAGNQPRESCIPEGDYQMLRGTFHRGGYPAYEILGVPGRSLIKIHRGNTMHDLLGCIAPGKALGWVANTWAVTSSRATYATLMAMLEGVESPSIRISQYQPTYPQEGSV